MLRKVASEGRETLAKLSTGKTTAALALRHSHPEWVVKLRRTAGGASRQALRCRTPRTLSRSFK